jgi:anthranilate synthase component I
VAKAQEYILAGDIFQVVLSQRLDLKLEVDPFEVYRQLRTVNPSPYLFYLKLDRDVVLGSSPEMLVKIDGRQAEYRPIAGTRHRGATEEDDRRMGDELLADEKERAEHIMLVDLGRNDLGRVCEYGSVRVKDLMILERYSHVIHIVSVIMGRLREGCDEFDALRACFPAGTLSGAPKVRAMEIIAELEPTGRGVYGGSVMYLDFSGNLNSCIAIRTMAVRGREAHIQVGAGIVADSVPEREWDETMSKAGALLRAVELATA